MTIRGLGACAAIAALVSACSAAGPATPKLDRDEKRLVELYVRLTLLEKLHAENPDSAEAGFRRLASSADSTVVRRALARLQREPLRWERVYEAISQELVRRQGGAAADSLPPRGE